MFVLHAHIFYTSGWRHVARTTNDSTHNLSILLMLRRTLTLLALCAPLYIGGCQCSEKPDIGPVEDEEAQLQAPEAPGSISMPLYG